MPTLKSTISLGLALLCTKASGFQTLGTQQLLRVQSLRIIQRSSCSLHGTQKELRPTKATCLFMASTVESSSSSPRAPNRIGLLWGMLNRQTALGAAVATLIISGAVAQGPPRLFLLHVAGMALGAFAFLPAALGATRSRAAAAQAAANPADRRPTLTRHIQAHFACSVAATLCWAAGLAGIVLTKNVQGKAHLTSFHSWLGFAAVLLWAAAGIAAELKVSGVAFTLNGFSVVSVPLATEESLSICSAFPQALLLIIGYKCFLSKLMTGLGARDQATSLHLRAPFALGICDSPPRRSFSLHCRHGGCYFGSNRHGLWAQGLLRPPRGSRSAVGK